MLSSSNCLNDNLPKLSKAAIIPPFSPPARCAKAAPLADSSPLPIPNKNPQKPSSFGVKLRTVAFIRPLCNEPLSCLVSNDTVRASKSFPSRVHKSSLPIRCQSCSLLPQKCLPSHTCLLKFVLSNGAVEVKSPRYDANNPLQPLNRLELSRPALSFKKLLRFILITFIIVC